MAKKQNRRKFFRNTSFQKREILGCFLLIIGGGLMFNVLVKQLPAANWFLGLFGIILIILAALLLTHRIIGPMFRFESTLDSMKQGYLDKTIKLREKDEGMELAQKINEFNGQLSQTFQTIGRNSKALDILIEQVAALDLPEKEKERLAGICWSMQEHNRRITSKSDYFSAKD